MHKTFLPEWYPQDAVLMAWPHEGTDWQSILDEVRHCYAQIIKAIVQYEHVLLLVNDPDAVAGYFDKKELESIKLITSEYNDTWLRDSGAITVATGTQKTLLDFKFNGWGGKFDATLDNTITRQMMAKGLFADNIVVEDHNDWELEGGSLETDGLGTILTTSSCLLDVNRNGKVSRSEVEELLKERLGSKQVLWLDHGHLEGDDTDGHIDTLARFCDEKTIAYVQCTDQGDAHYESMSRMEAELQEIARKHNYRLVALPMVPPCFDEGDRLPATYLNFLIINDAVLVPTYSCDLDVEVLNIYKQIFPDRNVHGIDCIPLIKQHGSLHCATMQFPKGTIK